MTAFCVESNNPTDTFNESVSSLLERKVRGWLGGVFEDMRRSSPVQQWLDSLPTTPGDEAPDLPPPSEYHGNTTTTHMPHDSPKLHESQSHGNTVLDTEEKTSSEDSAHTNLDISIPKEQWKRKSLENGVLTSTPHKQTSKKLQRDLSIQSEGYAPKFKNPLLRDASLQSDASGSSGSSVLNVLGARRVDAESVLLALGFGPSEKQQKLQRIPDRFLVPSKLNGISTDKFIKDEQHSMRMHDCGVFGYRGLTGNPHVPPSTIVAKIMECIVNDDASREQSLCRPRYSLGDARVPVAPPAIPPRIASRLHYE